MKKVKPEDMIVAHYNSRYLPLTEVWLYNQLRSLKGFNVSFISRKTQNLTMFPINNLFSLEELSTVNRFFNILFFKLFGYIPRFASQIKDARLLHVHFGYQGIKMAGLKRHLKIPMIVSFYGRDAFSFPFEKKHNKKRLVKMFQQADKILVLGPYMRDSLVDLGCPASKIIIHHLGVDDSKLVYSQRKHDPSRPIKFLLASSFVEKKGVDICLKALSNLKNRFDFTVDIIGDGPLKPTLQEIVQSGNMEDIVTFHGYQPYDFFISLASQSDVFLQASKTGRLNDKEGTPMSLVDVMATGLPVVSTKHSDIPEIVKDGETGFLAQENSVSDFEKAIMKMISNLSELSEYSKKSRNWILEQFSLEKQSERLSKIYSDVINPQ